MSNPMNFASALTGLPVKKPHVRGRKPSSKPGAQHLGLLQKAHAAGDMKAARTHALNYARASMMAPGGAPTAPTPGIDDETDEGMDMPTMAAPKAPVMPKAPVPNNRAALATMLMSRAKK